MGLNQCSTTGFQVSLGRLDECTRLPSLCFEARLFAQSLFILLDEVNDLFISILYGASHLYWTRQAVMREPPAKQNMNPDERH